MSLYFPCAEGCPHVEYCNKQMIMLCRIAYEHYKIHPDALREKKYKRKLQRQGSINMIDSKEGFEKLRNLLNVKGEIEKYCSGEINYHGLMELNNNGYPFFVQWNHKYPIITIETDKESKLIGLPKEIGFAVEKMLGNVTTEVEFQKQIDKAFRKKSKLKLIGSEKE